MKILMLNYEFPPLGGGAGAVTEELAETLSARGHAIDVVTMRYGNLPAHESKNGVEIYRVKSLRESKSISRPHEMLSYLPTGFAKARRLVSDDEYDLVHTHFIIPTGLIAYALHRLYDVPYYITAHGSDVPGYNPDRFTALHEILEPIWRRIAVTAESVISPSEHLGQMIDSASQETNVEIIPNGFDYERYNPNRGKEERILVTSRLFERKGIQHFLDALEEADPDWDVVITGEGPYMAHLEQKADHLDLNVEFTGWVERNTLKELLETSEIYVFPSSHENCPVALQEAMAAGSAIIASRYSGTREVIDEAGIVIDPEDTEEFASQLRTLVSDEDKRVELQKKSRDRIEEQFDWCRIAKRYERVYSGRCKHRKKGKTGISWNQ